MERYAFSRCALGPGAIVDRPPTPLGEAEIVRLPVLLSRSLRSLKRTVRLVAAQKEWAWLRILRKDGTSGHDRVCAPLALLFADRSTTLLASSSNGVAAGPNHTFAALRGLCELIERDAFMVAWYHRYPGARVDEAHILPADVVDWVRRQRACSIDFRLHDISSDLGFHVFLAYVVEYRGQQPVSFSCGAGCSLDPCEAASRAFLEAALSWRGGTELVSLRGRLSEAARAAFRPVTFSDHLFLYQHRGSLGWVSHLLDAPQCERTYTCASTESTIARQLQDAITTLERRGYKAYFLDMTPAEFRSFDLSVVRIVVPGLVPLVWGRHRPVFSTGSSPHRGFQLEIAGDTSTPIPTLFLEDPMLTQTDSAILDELFTVSGAAAPSVAELYHENTKLFPSLPAGAASAPTLQYAVQTGSSLKRNSSRGIEALRHGDHCQTAPTQGARFDPARPDARRPA